MKRVAIVGALLAGAVSVVILTVAALTPDQPATRTPAPHATTVPRATPHQSPQVELIPPLVATHPPASRQRHATEHAPDHQPSTRPTSTPPSHEVKPEPSPTCAVNITDIRLCLPGENT